MRIETERPVIREFCQDHKPARTPKKAKRLTASQKARWEHALDNMGNWRDLIFMAFSRKIGKAKIWGKTMLPA